MDHCPLTIHIPAPPPATCEPRTPPATAQKTGPRTRIVGSSTSAIPTGNLYGRYIPERSRPVICSRKYRLAAPNSTPKRQPDDADRHGLHPDSLPDLPAESADCAQHPQLALSIDDRDGQRVDDAEDRDEHGDEHLAVRELQPLIGQLQDPAPDLGVRQDEQSAADRRRHAARIRCLTSIGSAAGFHVHAKHVHSIVAASADRTTRRSRTTAPC